MKDIVKYVAVIICLAAGVYVLGWMKDAKIGAALIGAACLLIDPVDVLKALGIWKGSAQSSAGGAP